VRDRASVLRFMIGNPGEVWGEQIAKGGRANQRGGAFAVPADINLGGGSYLRRRAAAAEASTTLSTSSRQRKISIASTG